MKRSVFFILGLAFTLLGLIFIALGLFVAGEVISGENGSAYVFRTVNLGVGVPFLCVGIPFLCVDIFRAVRRRRLIESGTVIYAKIDGVERRWNMQMNGRNPYVILCVYQDPQSNAICIFRSEDIWFNPETVLKARGIEMLPVYVDAHNMKRYYVSVEDVTRDILVR